MRIARRLFHALLILLLQGVVWPVQAHELAANRLTVVQRDGRHLSLTLFVDLPQALHRALAPATGYREFVLAHAAMSPDELAAALRPALSRFDAGTRLTLSAGRPAPGVRWRWPPAAQVRAALQQQAMGLVVAPAGHAHVEPAQVHADWQSDADITALALQLPAEFGDVLVVSYRPAQAWARPKAPPLALKF